MVYDCKDFTVSSWPINSLNNLNIYWLQNYVFVHDSTYSFHNFFLFSPPSLSTYPPPLWKMKLRVPNETWSLRLWTFSRQQGHPLDGTHHRVTRSFFYKKECIVPEGNNIKKYRKNIYRINHLEGPTALHWETDLISCETAPLKGNRIGLKQKCGCSIVTHWKLLQLYGNGFFLWDCTFKGSTSTNGLKQKCGSSIVAPWRVLPFHRDGIFLLPNLFHWTKERIPLYPIWASLWFWVQFQVYRRCT
jgi:hypothetical protein